MATGVRKIEVNTETSYAPSLKVLTCAVLLFVDCLTSCHDKHHAQKQLGGGKGLFNLIFQDNS